MSLLEAARRLRDACEDLPLRGVPYAYNPLAYAWEPHAAYCERYGKGDKGRVLLVGMNPGPWGMAQTGVPFGDVQMVRGWMGIEGAVMQPDRQHPRRPVTGFATTRREPSGTRLYGWAQQRYGSAESFFGRFFIANYCPLLFLNEEGKNLTPPDLPRVATTRLYEACDRHLAEVVQALRPRCVVGVGAFAQGRAQQVVEAHGLDVPVGQVLHPSPASPAANRGWAAQAEAQLEKLGAL